MKTLRIVILAFTVGIALGISTPARAGAGGQADFLVGALQLTDDRLDEAGAGSSTIYGVRAALDFGWPVSLTAALRAASSNGSRDVPGEFPQTIETDAESLELDLGVRRDFRTSENLRPYIAGGLALIRLTVEQVQRGSFGPGTDYADVVLDDEDAGLGYWLGGGLVYRFAKIHVGLDVQWAGGSAELSPPGGGGELDLDTGGASASILVGYHW